MLRARNSGLSLQGLGSAVLYTDFLCRCVVQPVGMVCGELAFVLSGFIGRLLHDGMARVQRSSVQLSLHFWVKGTVGFIAKYVFWGEGRHRIMQPGTKMPLALHYASDYLCVHRMLPGPQTPVALRSRPLRSLHCSSCQSVESIFFRDA